MITVRAGSGAIGVCLLLVLTGCSREQQDWRSAESADTIESYGQFIQSHPESELATQARARVAQLGEERDWQHAGSADTVDAYREFLAQHPNGKWSQEARIRIENFSLGEQAGTPASSTRQVSVAPQGPPASPGAAPTQAPPAPAGAPRGAYGIQLGAFTTEAGANAQWHTLASQYATELQGLQQHLVPADTASGRVYRLQATVGDESRARSLCDELKKHGQGCVAVLPH